MATTITDIQLRRKMMMMMCGATLAHWIPLGMKCKYKTTCVSSVDRIAWAHKRRVDGKNDWSPRANQLKTHSKWMYRWMNECDWLDCVHDQSCMAVSMIFGWYAKICCIIWLPTHKMNFPLNRNCVASLDQPAAAAVVRYAAFSNNHHHQLSTQSNYH